MYRKLQARLAATTVGAVTIMAMAAGPAAAAPPVVVLDETFEDNYSVPAEEDPCGVDTDVTLVEHVRITEFLDKDGNVRSAQVHVHGTTTTTSAHGELVDRWALTERFDLEAGTVATTGNVWNVHPASGGRVLINDSGRVVMDLETGEPISIRGPHDTLEGNFEAACAILNP